MSDNAKATVNTEAGDGTDNSIVNVKILHSTINACFYIYAIAMIIISILLFINTVYNVIIFYNYRSERDEENGDKKLYISDTFAYKLFISKLVDFNNNNNSTYFTLNVSNNLIYIFIILTMLFFLTLYIIDSFITSKILIKSIATEEVGNAALVTVYIFVSIVLILGYYLVMFNNKDYNNNIDYVIGLIAFYILISVFCAGFIAYSGSGAANNLSLLYIFAAISKTKKYAIIYGFIFAIWIVLLIFSYISNKNQNVVTYEEYSFNIPESSSGYTLEQYFYKTYFNGQSTEKIEKTRSLLEGHNVNTIDSIPDPDSPDKKKLYIDNIIGFLKDIKKYACKLSLLDKRDNRLDFIKLMVIFINNIIIKEKQPKDILSQNKIEKEFYYLTNSKEQYESLNINNLLIGAFPVEYLK
jgi:hypothetical protein